MKIIREITEENYTKCYFSEIVLVTPIIRGNRKDIDPFQKNLYGDRVKHICCVVDIYSKKFKKSPNCSSENLNALTNRFCVKVPFPDF